MKTIYKILIIAGLVILLFFGVTPVGRALWNNWFFAVQKVDDVTSYQTIKKVEDTCRAMIASYNTDVLAYEQYKESNSSEKQGWGEQAKMRANKTASTYNAYILHNSFIWKDNVPSDIDMELPHIQ